MSNQNIVLVPTAGLCNRMRAISSGVYLSKKLDIQLYIYWIKRKECFADFTDLFLPISIVNVSLHHLKFSEYYLLPDEKRNFFLPGLIRRFIFKKQIVNPNKALLNIFDKIDIKGGYITTPHSMCNHFSLHEIFIPTLDIQSKIQSITDKFSPNVVGIHIRRTDHIRSINNNSIEDFYNRMDIEIKLNDKTNFYIATDSISVKEDLILRYGDRIIFYNAQLSRNSVQGMKDAVIDLWCLSSTKYIIGSFYSSYSELAAELGGIKLVIL